ncbi:hypothetical protein C8Q73DRAFT_436462 [Cubamyces lactineus]|nr:hypothetical protein C8Q73DRAFT_436462 [Cubamyces lactineus]
MEQSDLVAYCYAVRTEQIIGLSSVAAIAFATWDLALSISDEVDLIWRTPGKWSKSLYICTRYVPWLGEIALYAYLTDSNRELRLTVEQCAMSDLVEAIVLGSVIVIVEVVLLIRGESPRWVQHIRYSLRSTTVYALYERSRPVLLGLLGGFATHICVTACGVLYTMKEFDYNIECLSSTAPRIVLLMWLSPMAFETALFVMTVIKFWENRRCPLRKRPILYTIIRDGTWAFALTLLILGLNAIAYTVHPEKLTGIFYFWALSTLSLTVSGAGHDLHVVGAYAVLRDLMYS